MNETSTATVIWRRTIDHDATTRRRNRFLLFYCLPVAVLALGFGVVSGPWEALGILILFGGFGLLIGAWIYLHGRNLRANPTMTYDGVALRVGKKEVPIGAVQRWTTYPRKVSSSTPSAHGGTTTSSITVHVAGFIVTSGQPDGSVRDDEHEFVWPLLSDDDQLTLRAALESALPGRWVPLESFHSVRS